VTADDAQASWEDATQRHQRSLPRERRKQAGAWFTPLDLAAATARHALRGLDMTRPNVCDPAVGGGAFLHAARRHVPDAHLTGVDVDEHAVQLARELLGEANVDLRVGDGLTELEPGTFDCVLTNPPWETLQSAPGSDERVAALRPRFEHQGRGKLFTYRLFVERAVQLLRPGGRLGMLVPASLWFDRDAEPLRRLLLDTCDWRWLYGFENRARVFEIDSRYRFGAIVAQKGARTRRVRVAFGRTDVDEWAKLAPPHVVYGRDELRALSPHSGAFVEVEHRRDLDILARMHDGARPLLGDDGALRWRQGDFNMTSHKGRFVLREHAERADYAHDGRGTWRANDRPDLLPLVQGAMIYDLQANAGAHEHGVGHKTKWRAPTTPDELRPLYLVDAAAWREGADERAPTRIALRALSNATNERTAIACLMPDLPCGNSLGVLQLRERSAAPLRDLAALCAVLGSLPFDWALRMRMGGTNVNGFVLRDCALPPLDERATLVLARCAMRLCATTPWHEGLLRRARREGWLGDSAPARVDEQRRELTTTIDVEVGRAFGLTRDDVAWITRGQPFAKGFWRVERELPERSRRPARWSAAL